MPADATDAALYGAIVRRMQAGEGYYAVTGQELHSRGYATAPVLNWRLPTLASAEAALGSLASSARVLTLLGLSTVALWGWALTGFTVLRRALTYALLLTMLPLWLNDQFSLFHELWAGQLIALSLACWACGLVVPSLVAGAMALAVRELALPYVLVMLVAAHVGGRRRERWAWAAVVGAFVVFYAWHAAVVLPLIPADPLTNSWMGLGSWCFDLLAAHVNPFVFRAPAWLVAILLPILAVGLWRWPGPAGRRVAVTISVYLAMFSVVGRPDNWYWGLLIAPLLPLGILGWGTIRYAPARQPAGDDGESRASRPWIP